MVYNIAEIKYTSCYPVICNLVPKRQTLCTQARAIKSKFLKISTMLSSVPFVQIQTTMPSLLFCTQNRTTMLSNVPFVQNQTTIPGLLFCTQNRTTMHSIVFLSSETKQLSLAFFFVPKTELYAL